MNIIIQRNLKRRKKKYENLRRLMKNLIGFSDIRRGLLVEKGFNLSHGKNITRVNFIIIPRDMEYAKLEKWL